MRVYYEIETKKRELDARILFSIIGASRGLSVVIGKKNRLIEKTKFLEPGVYIFKSSQRRIPKEGKYLKDKNFSIFTSDEEGLINISENEVMHRISKKGFDITDKFLAWGNEQADIIKKNYDNVSGKIIIAGNSRFDLLKNPVNQIYQQEADEIKKKYGEFDLYISAFHKANAISYPGTDWLTGTKFDSEWREKLFTNMFETQKKNLKLTLDFFNKNQKKLERKIIFRPHPAEKISTWTNELSDELKDNVIFDHLNTNAWILAANKVYSFYSTSIIEASILGKKPINLIFSEEKKIHETKLFDICSNTVINPTNYEDLKNKIKENDINYSVKDLEDKLEYYCKYNKSYFAELVCDEIIKNFKNKFDNVKKDKYSNMFFFIFFKYLQKIRNLIFLSKDDTDVKITLQKNPGIDLQEVKKKIENISGLLKINDIKCKEIYPGIFEIKKDNGKELKNKVI